MSTTTYSSFGAHASESRRLSRAIRWSIAVHLVVVAILFLVPRSWLTRTPEPREVMTISLGGTPGPRSTGTTSIGGRTVEQVAPPPKRPEPVRPTPKVEPAAVAPVKAPPKPQAAPTPSSTPKPEPQAATRPPVTGPQVVAGNTAVETGARGQGAGLTFGGGLNGGETDLSSFCCPQYLSQTLAAIDDKWAKSHPERGTTILKFTIRRNGTIDNVTVEQASGYGVLDRAARAALLDARLLALPAEYPNETLTVHLTFPYGTQ